MYNVYVLEFNIRFMKNRNLCKVLKFLFLSKLFFIGLILSYIGYI